MSQSTYTVECEGGEAAPEAFPGLTHDRAVERCEAQRAKGLWAVVTIRCESSGQVFARYPKPGPAPGAGGGA